MPVRFSDRFLQFAYSVITYSTAAYGFVRKVLPLPARSTIYSRFSDALSRVKANLTDLNQTINLLEAQKLGTHKIPCTLGVDTFAFRLFLRRKATVTELRQEFTVDQLRMLQPLLEDRKLFALVEKRTEEEEEENERDDDDPLPAEEDTNEQCDSDEDEDDVSPASNAKTEESADADSEDAKDATENRISRFTAYGSAFVYVLMP